MQLSGFKTGLFISPHLVRFNERISIDGEDISDDDLFRIENNLCQIYDEQSVKPDLVIFDMITMIAFKYFEEKKVDYAIVEVGMGGTLDPTNIVTPEISIITSIGYDHMQILGSTLEQISSQKLGIWKPGVPVVIGPDWPQTFMKDYIESDMGLNLDIVNFLNHTPAAKGNYQLENTEIVKKWWEILNQESQILSDDAINEGLKTEIPGRLQKMAENIYFDGAHNPAGIIKSISTLLSKLPSDSEKQVIILWGFSQITNVNANFSTIFNHENADRIKDIILVESNDFDVEFINLLPSWIKVQTLMKSLQGSTWNKVKVLCSKDNENYEIKPVSKCKVDSNFSKYSWGYFKFESIMNWLNNTTSEKEEPRSHAQPLREHTVTARDSFLSKCISIVKYHLSLIIKTLFKIWCMLSKRSSADLITGDVQTTLNYVKNQKENKEWVILVLGSFRLYRSVNKMFLK